MTDSVCHAHILSRVLCILPPQESDWSSEDWDGTKDKVRKQTDTLMTLMNQGPQMDTDKATDIDEVAFSKLQIGQSNLKEELIEVTDSLIPPPPVMETPGDMKREYQQRRTIGNREEASAGRREI